MAAKDRVEMFIAPSRVGEEDVIIGVQGKLHQIPRGVTVKVPPAVKAEYERSVRATQRRYASAKKMKENGGI